MLIIVVCGSLKFKLILSKIGVVLIAFNVILLIPLFPFPLSSFVWVIGGFYYASEHALIVYSIFLSTATIGLILYVIGRKEFSDYLKESEIVSGLLTFLGFIVIAGSMFSFLEANFFTRTYVGSSGVRPPVTWKDVAAWLCIVIWCGLEFISGLLLLIDGGRMGEDKVLHLKKEIDFEEAKKKYPKDLFAKYVERYPHNPTGVLEWHIHKKMKEGKTREQAIEELHA